jgi:hypothetical protein
MDFPTRPAPCPPIEYTQYNKIVYIPDVYFIYRKIIDFGKYYNFKHGYVFCFSCHKYNNQTICYQNYDLCLICAYKYNSIIKEYGMESYLSNEHNK